MIKRWHSVNGSGVCQQTNKMNTKTEKLGKTRRTAAEGESFLESHLADITKVRKPEWDFRRVVDL